MEQLSFIMNLTISLLSNRPQKAQGDSSPRLPPLFPLQKAPANQRESPPLIQVKPKKPQTKKREGVIEPKSCQCCHNAKWCDQPTIPPALRKHISSPLILLFSLADPGLKLFPKLHPGNKNHFSWHPRIPNNFSRKNLHTPLCSRASQRGRGTWQKKTIIFSSFLHQPIISLTIHTPSLD